ncbi:OsmC family protein [Fodinibius sediminis]|uniref:Putative redox protein n=1 Tax=Fodinibius sediminis TaxID=1214077 RepID=A0A521EDQ5_9BACT|nr:OsmC family protein [Fodinibius sediminis]SMO82049.1 putative redox protein [Fodinibius sediminis]
MNIEITQVNDAVHFEARNGAGNSVHVDGAEAVGGEGKGMRPMELMLVSVASCSAIDVVEILKKQRQPLQNLRISVSGERPESGAPRPYTSIALHFTLFGDLAQSKVARAVKLAVEDYCSARATLSDDVKVSHSFEIKSAEEIPAYED